MNKIQICNQIELNYIDEGEGIPIILIHGLDGNLAGFKDLKNELKKQYRVITYDVRGHGKSSRTESYELKDHVEDLNDLMGALNIFFKFKLILYYDGHFRIFIRKIDIN